MARNSGQVCHYFLQGHCRFGDNCWNEHPRQHAGRANAGSGRRVAWSGHNQKYSNPVQTSSFSKSTSWHNRDSGFSQNRYAALNSTENVGNSGIVDEEDKLLEIIMKDMESWESSGQWMFSTYSPTKEKPNISGFPDFLPEELRLEYYNSRANNNVQNYINSVQQLASQWRSRLLELKNINASTKAALISEFKNTASQPPPAFGFGGQQASAFGSSAFPVDNKSAQAFSFKPASELGSISSGSTPAFGSLTSSQGTASSTAAPHAVSFGDQPASSASSFSFKMATTTPGGFGASGFAGFGKPFPASSPETAPASVFGTAAITPALNPGFGKSFPASSSDSTSASVFGTAAASASLNSGNTLFGQPASLSGGNATLPPSTTPPSTTSAKLFTPESELSAEELEQFKAKKFTLGKIPSKPPPASLLNL
ncbi:nucleoporin NUP42 isoform X1 [Podarcis lilfordi]|uniref:Nucleoporin NUP42 n=1 Tax=Podarcis lilfordi TaxID=74358 RepID=A0AA35PK88_9SAUR|nr:nucleoporin NUP42 isoform X1 [Podarcis lilfordi]